ncbi:MAG: exodeoxyribonuclease VII large subunit, partial [Lautropia sp.]
SNFTRAASGHWYFTLKDPVASVRAVMFRSAARLVGFAPREGDRIEVLARVSLYEARGEYQLGVERMRQAGAGDLYQRFLRLKALLAAEGLFDAGRKRPLPPRPRVIGIISSPRAAALRDVLATLARRAPQLSVVIYPAPVQGREAPAGLIAALAAANRRGDCDVLLMVRGGGSFEDLDAFNDEQLARRIAASGLPVVSGVGHETDFTICDFVADLRAPTPTAAAELVSRDRAEELAQLQRQRLRLARGLRTLLERAAQRLDVAERLLRSPSRQAELRLAAVERQGERLAQAMRAVVAHERARLRLAAAAVRPPRLELPLARIATLQATLLRLPAARLDTGRQRLEHLESALALVNPRGVLERGYAIVRDAGGTIVRRPAQVAAGAPLAIELAEGRLGAVATGAGTAHAQQDT